MNWVQLQLFFVDFFGLIEMDGFEYEDDDDKEKIDEDEEVEIL